MPHWQHHIVEGFKEGLAKGWRSFLWVLKLILPISLLTVLFEYSGILGYLDSLLAPLMGFMGLPSMAAFPIVAGALAGVYAAVGALAVLPLTQAQMTLVAIFVLIAHMLIQEGIIQARSGFHLGKATVVRLSAAVATVTLCSFFIDTGVDPVTAAPAVAAVRPGLAEMLGHWFIDMAWLSLKILWIVMSIMIGLAWMRRFNLVPLLVRWMRPVLALLGLGPRVGVLWLSAVLFGVTYGAAVIVEEFRAGSFEHHEIERLHVSIGINHSMVEDPLLFLPLGIGIFWLYVPRFVAAMVAVRIYDAIEAVVQARRLRVHRRA
jgi:spore maturation protein SpmB